MSTLLLGFVIYRWMSQPLARLADFALRVSRGERIDAPDLGRNEIGDVCRAVESMREALEGKEYSERYVQTLTHELKSPLAAIRGAVDARRRRAARAARAFTPTSAAKPPRLQDLVDRMLQLTDLEKRRSLKASNRSAVCQLLEEIVRDFEVECLNRGSYAQARNATPTRQFRASASPCCARRCRRPGAKRHRLLPLTGRQAANPNARPTTLSDRHQPSSTTAREYPDYAQDRVFERFYLLPHDQQRQKEHRPGPKLRQGSRRTPRRHRNSSPATTAPPAQMSTIRLHTRDSSPPARHYSILGHQTVIPAEAVAFNKKYFRRICADRDKQSQPL